jgi:hypothetical protein
LLALLFVIPSISYSQDESVTEPVSVWNLTFVRTKANMGDDYLKNLKNTWGASMAAFEKEGLIESYMILDGNAFGDDDFDLILMVEFKNYATFDPNPERKAKFKQVQEQVAAAMGGEDKMESVVKNYPDMREILGTKTMSQIKFKE